MDVFLSPVESGKLIAENASRIKINDNELKKVARIIIDAVKDNSISKVEFAAQVLHPKNGGKEAVNWVFFMDTINFSFWPDEGAKYDVSYKGNIYTGYFAACAAVNKMLDSGVDVTSAEWMASANEEDINKVFLSDSGHSIPLLEERVKAINESGRILLQKWDGSFFNCVLAAKKSAQELLNLIIKDFSSFRDFAYFQGKKVSFLKRAQILVADVLGSLKGTHSAGDFFDIDSLTMFADYRVPQVLAYLGVLEYSQELLDILRERKLLDNGSAEEVELRGASIWACERIVFAIDELRATEGNEIRKVNAAEVDVFLWVYRRQNAKEIDSKMFKKFDEKEDVSGATQLKSSIQKGIRNRLIESYPHIEPYLNDILPKKENFKLIKCKDHVELLADHNGIVQFVKTRNTEFIPTLRLLHKYPFILPQQQVDKGAIKFVLNGSSIMCPGLTSAGAKMTPGLCTDTVVAIMAEGKQHALAIGQMKMSSEEIQKVNKGIGIENIHYLNDGLWRLADKAIN